LKEKGKVENKKVLDYLKLRILKRIYSYLKKWIHRMDRLNLSKYFKRIRKYFIQKNGIEVGGPSAFFEKEDLMPIYQIAHSIDCINYSSSTVWTGEIDTFKGFTVKGKKLGIQYIGEATEVTSFVKGSYDFVLSCNNIEHIANPLKAIEQWLGILKPKGIFVLVVPRKESNFDYRRSTTQFDHLIDDYKNDTKENDLTHLDEILKLHDLNKDPKAGTFEQFRERSLLNVQNRCLHHHVFDMNLLKKIFKYFGISIVNGIKMKNDYIITGQK